MTAPIATAPIATEEDARILHRVTGHLRAAIASHGAARLDLIAVADSAILPGIPGYPLTDTLRPRPSDRVYRDRGGVPDRLAGRGRRPAG